MGGFNGCFSNGRNPYFAPSMLSFCRRQDTHTNTPRAQDFAKTRLQLPGNKLGLIQVISKTWKQEGPQALWKGLSPALLRQCCYTSLSLVLYNPFRDVLSQHTSSNGEISFLARLVAGGSAGGVAILCFNWADVLKVKIQASTDNSLSMRTVFRQVYATQGIRGFWSGG